MLLKLKPDKTSAESAELAGLESQLAVEQAKYDACFDTLAKQRQCWNCHCQWGLTCIFSGIVVMLAACVFTFFPVFMQVFTWDWYEMACWAWAILGFAMFSFGIVKHCFCGGGKQASGREIMSMDSENGAPIPYVMLDA